MYGQSTFRGEDRALTRHRVNRRYATLAPGRLQSRWHRETYFDARDGAVYDNDGYDDDNDGMAEDRKEDFSIGNAFKSVGKGIATGGKAAGKGIAIGGKAAGKGVVGGLSAAGKGVMGGLSAVGSAAMNSVVGPVWSLLKNFWAWSKWLAGAVSVLCVCCLCWTCGCGPALLGMAMS